MTFLVTLALLLAEPAPPTEAQPAAPYAQISLAEAGRAIAAGRLDQARTILGVAVSAGAKGEPVDRLLADLHYADGQYEQALAYYRQLISAHPDELLLLERAGICALRLGRNSEATAMLDRATRQPAAGWRAWNARGVAADRQGRWDEADAAYSKAAEIDPGKAEVANNLGWSLMLRGKWAEALQSFERAASIDAKLPRLANNIELARSAVAADLPVRMAGESDDRYAARLNDAGVVAVAAGQSKRAEAAFSQALEIRSRWYARAAENLAAVSSPK